MLVSTALLSVIVLGLTAMFIETQKAFKSGLKQTNVTDAGRAIIDMMASDFSQMSDPHFTNFYIPPNTYVTPPLNPAPPTMYWSFVPSYSLYQVLYTNASGVTVYRTNVIEDIFGTVLTNNTWLGIGYAISNWFTNSAGGSFPGVGTLYRYVGATNAPLTPTNLLFANFLTQVGNETFTNTLFHRIADGVVHMKIYVFDASGNLVQFMPIYFGPTSSVKTFYYPAVVTNFTSTNMFQTNFLPRSMDIELGILEPEAFQHVVALYSSGATTAAQTYLANAIGQVQVFRQHILIPAAP